MSPGEQPGREVGEVIRAILLMILLAACTPAATATPTPPATPSGYTDAEQTAILRESIELVYGTAPQPNWYASLAVIDGQLDVTVEDRWAYVGTNLTNLATAEAVCAAIAGATFDDNAEPIGVTDVMVGGAGNQILTDCDVR